MLTGRWLSSHMLIWKKVSVEGAKVPKGANTRRRVGRALRLVIRLQHGRVGVVRNLGIGPVGRADGHPHSGRQTSQTGPPTAQRDAGEVSGCTVLL